MQTPTIDTSTTSGPPAHAGRPHTLRAGAGARLFDGGDTLIDDDAMRANWAVPWSDLMMTMFVLFAALLAAQAVHHGGGNQPADAAMAPQAEPATAAKAPPAALPDAAAPASVLEKSQDAMRDADIKGVQIAELNDKSIQVRMQGAMFFAAGKAELRPDVTLLLYNLAKVIKDTPYDIQVVGHTDDTETAGNSGGNAFASNWELSLGRANQVARHLMEAGGIEPSRFMIVGRGKYHPLSPNTDEAARSLNRRVEIIITRNVSSPGKDEIQ